MKRELVALFALLVGWCLAGDYIVTTVYDCEWRVCAMPFEKLTNEFSCHSAGDCSGNTVLISATLSGSCTLGYLTECSGNNITYQSCANSDCSGGCSSMT